MIAMLRPDATSLSEADEAAMRASKERKDEARSRVLAKLLMIGEVSGSMREIRTKLGLDDMSMNLFAHSCWYLRGDPDKGVPARIIMLRVGDRDRGWRTNEPRPFTIRPIHS